MDQWTQPPQSPATVRISPGGNAAAFRPVVAVLGIVWLINAGFAFMAWVWRAPGADTGLPHVLAKAVSSAPPWLRPLVADIATGIDRLGARGIAAAMAVVALLLGLALITRVGLRAACWFGVAYSIFCWIALCGLGAPYGPGQTDPGVFPAYLISFLFVLSVAPVVAPRGNAAPALTPSPTLWTTARLLFGLLWLFDATLKWKPYFLSHFLKQLTPAVQGQPHWIATYIAFVINAVQTIRPELVAVLVAIIETGIAVSLLTGLCLRTIAPLAFLYSLAVWTTAEGWGGPYSAAGTGIRGNVVGNALIYAIIFLFFLVPGAYRPRKARVVA